MCGPLGTPHTPHRVDHISPDVTLRNHHPVRGHLHTTPPARPRSRRAPRRAHPHRTPPHLARQQQDRLKPLSRAACSQNAVTSRSGKKPYMSAQPPQAFLNGITRQSHPAAESSRTPTPAPRVTASHRAAGRVCSTALYHPVRPGERHGTSSRGGRARERTFRATPFFAHTHHRAHDRSTDPHRLRVARRQQEGRRQRRHPDRRHRRRRTDHRRPVRPRPRHQELRRPRRQDGQQGKHRPRHQIRGQAPRRPGTALGRPAERPEVHRRRHRRRRRRPPELRRLPVDAEAAQRQQASPRSPPPTPAPSSPRARTGRPATRSAPSRPTSAPPPRTRSRAPSQRSTSTTTRRSSRSTSSTTRSPTAPVSPRPSRTPSPPSAARSSAPTT